MDSNVGHFNLDAETVFRPYLASHCCKVDQTPRFVLPPYATRAVHVWSKSGNKKGHFALEAEKVFRPYLATHGSGVTLTSNLEHPPHAPPPVEVWSKSICSERHFTIAAETLSSPSRLLLQRGSSNTTRGTPSSCFTT
jgi:hypothetical protein